MTTPFITRRFALASGLVSSLMLGAAPLLAQQAEGTARAIEEMALGAADAPVTVVEYASLTCPHCAAFHTNVFDKLKANYIETGKVRFIVRDVYFDRYGLWAAMVARCGGKMRYFGLTDRLFTRQAEWSRLEDPAAALDAIFTIGRQAGLTDDQMDACVQDQAWAEALVADYQKNMEADQVTGTPTFFVNGDMQQNMPYPEFSAMLDAAIAKATGDAPVSQ